MGRGVATVLVVSIDDASVAVADASVAVADVFVFADGTATANVMTDADLYADGDAGIFIGDDAEVSDGAGTDAGAGACGTAGAQPGTGVCNDVDVNGGSCVDVFFSGVDVCGRAGKKLTMRDLLFFLVYISVSIVMSSVSQYFNEHTQLSVIF